MSILLGLSMFVGLFYYVILHQPTTFHGYFELTSLLLLALSPICIAIMAYGVIDVLTSFKILFSQTFFNTSKQLSEVGQNLLWVHQIIWKEGIGSAVQNRTKLKYRLLQEGVSMLAGGFDVKEIAYHMTLKVYNRKNRLLRAGEVYDFLARISPGMGLVGTVTGLIQMLSNLQEPDRIGGGLAVSLLTTLYGILFGNVLYQPLSEQMFFYADAIENIGKLICDGVVAIKENKSSSQIQELITTYTLSNGKP